MPETKNSRFLEFLRQTPEFTDEIRLKELVEKHGPDTAALLQAVIDARLLSRDEACRQWANALGFAYVDPFASVITEDAVEKIPLEIAKKVHAIGLYTIEGILTVAMAAPEDAAMVRRLGQIAQLSVSPVFAPARDIEDAIAIHYSSDRDIELSLSALERSDLFTRSEYTREQLAALAESTSLVQVLDAIIFYAIRERATDIHIEPQEMQSRIRFRIDGMLRETLSFSRKLHLALICRIKVLCNLDISESRIPQDGRFSQQVGGGTTHFRISIIPSAHGEKVVMRLLAGTARKTMLTLDKMLMSQSVLLPFRRLIQNPNGIIFVTGPTGCGKTTTLYAALHEINKPDINISTIEDPVEIEMAGVTQTQINPQIDLRFSTILRSLLRQDPDVILIGEIRDLETARIATEAALTGHLVFASLHTNTAAQAIVRLMEIGVAAYMVAPSVIGVLAQRLAARICEHCKEAYYPSPDVLKRYFLDDGLTEVPFYRGRGCPKCRGTGYKGRIAFHELVLITEEIRTLISEGRSAQEITRAAAKIGYRPLRYDGLKKVLLGLTTIDEIEQNTSFEWAS
ncbi:MAG TPA: GspE/PulE family protein [Alphaproteobacteria bacterium]|nr:GspE/PulE family protein [Alphaproteobacteria bacterium]